MKAIRIFLLITLFAFTASAQKVGLVLSGGAAKGLAHVGVLKALEEHDIPIDYIVGTSMGGIIGGCYAAGMSPDQIEHIVLSDEFLRWVNGVPEPGYNYFYHESDANPHFLKVHLSLDSILNFQLNTSIASDVSLNFVLAEKMAQASAISLNNFDSLFVPLRVVAADIFTQNQVVLANGSLSDALRATQTVPFFYNPIRVNGKYLFDGGVYNNFPVDVVQEVFKPDVIIGANVSTKIYNEYPYDLDEKLISNSLLFLLLDKSDPARVPKEGVYIQPDLASYTSFDFSKARTMIDSGYVQTLRQIDEIRQKVGSRRTCDEVTERRNRFNNRNPQFVFDRVVFKGFNQKQSKYLHRIFHYNAAHPKPLYYNGVKKSYFRLVSEQYFANVYPNILYDSTSDRFQFQLIRRPQKNFQVDFGGVIATRDISNIFLGLNFYSFNKRLLHVYSGFHTGNFYKSAIVKARLDFPFQAYIEPVAEFNSWDHLANNDFINESDAPTVLKRISRNYGVHIGWPIGNLFKNSIGIEGINNIDKYGNHDIFISTDTLDRLHLSGFKAEMAFSANTLNRKQYASTGQAYRIVAQYMNVRENFDPGSTSVISEKVSADHQWFRLKATAEQYFNAGWFRPGYYVEAVFSNQKFFQNYKGTLINAPAFYPLQDSRTLLLENFRAFNYIAGGVRNVFSIRSRLDFRIEGYLFKPIDHLEENTGQEPFTTSELKAMYLAASAGLVLHSPIGPISLSANYYDDKENQFGILLHVGFLLYNKHAVE
jgi:NTE family protein